MRLIDADELKKTIEVAIKDSGFYSPIYRGFAKAIDVAPTIDAEPVLHGHWEFKDDLGNRDYDFVAVCSRCGKEQKAIGYSHIEWRLEWRYCNACGAKMDEVSE